MAVAAARPGKALSVEFAKPIRRGGSGVARDTGEGQQAGQGGRNETE
ncbi:hypothetical protein AB0K12_38100 [Nonomuraea sp. NPDC049419]